MLYNPWKAFGFVLLLACSNLAYSATATGVSECTVVDQDGQRWQARHRYERVANTEAFATCRKNSRQPRSCRLLEGECESFYHGMSSRPQWRCVAFDHEAQRWSGQPHTNRDSAALSAKARCQTHSKLPTSCYVNLITCTNLHKRN